MASVNTVLIDGVDVAQFGLTVVKYDVDVLAAPKDGGGLDVEGIDGLLETSSRARKGSTGSIELYCKGLSEADVRAQLRRFKQMLINTKFHNIISSSDARYYRRGQLTQSTEYRFVDLPYVSEAACYVTFSIQFVDAYEYDNQPFRQEFAVTNIYAADELIKVTNSMNPGDGYPSLRITLSAEAVALRGRWRIHAYYVGSDGTNLPIGNLYFGFDDLTTVVVPPYSDLVVDFTRPSIEITNRTTGVLTKKISLYYGGSFFSIPTIDNFRIQVQRVAQSGDSGMSRARATYKVEFRPRFA